MCTVTVVSKNNKLIITSNRDEVTYRRAETPRFYEVKGKSVYFPKDPAAGGTWFATDTQQKAIVLLNGAFEKHKHQPPYRLSRGLIVLELLIQEDVISAIDSIDLDRVEPFTLVIYQNGSLHEFRWNGFEKFLKPLSRNDNHIYSSATLYDAETRLERESWFAEFLERNPQPDADTIFKFHNLKNAGNSQNGIVMKRANQLQTISITQLVETDKGLEMKYVDLLENKENPISVA
ncbi:NRDE family protein [Flavobacterium sp.]|uniref:NRDE family protein n=1 Tax=Flavobacterium sp. TaxID=239 RepID=UPI002616BDE6|nr:NRDE family protein [Flavobacterium sp.]